MDWIHVFWRRSIECAVGKMRTSFCLSLRLPQTPSACQDVDGADHPASQESLPPAQAGSALTLTFSFRPYNRLRREESRLGKFNFTNEKLRM